MAALQEIARENVDACAGDSMSAVGSFSEPSWRPTFDRIHRLSARWFSLINADRGALIKHRSLIATVSMPADCDTCVVQRWQRYAID
ncbi:unnamed protein product, partial [Iphiclides podalirius]